MRYKAVLLDVDGVLIDSERVFNCCWRKASEMMGYSMTYEQALELRSLDSSLAQKLFTIWYNDENAYSLIRIKRKALMAEYKHYHSFAAKCGVIEFLDVVKKTPIKVVVVTSSPIKRITEYLFSAGVDCNLFDKIVTTEQVIKGKPFPDVYQYACKMIDCKPEDCIAIEDSPNGVKSAYGAGLKTIMIPDLSPCTDDLAPMVNICVDNIRDVIDFLC